MAEKRFVRRYAGRTIKKLIGIEDIETNRVCVTIEENIRLLNELNDENEQLKDKNKELQKENEQLKQDIGNLKITIKARETLIDVCEKKFKEWGYIITVDDDGYVIE